MLLKSLSEKVGQYTLVLIMLLIALVALPFSENFPVGRMVLNVWSLLTVALLVLSLSQGRRQSLLVILLGALLIGCLFIYFVGQLFLGREFIGVGMATLGLVVVFFLYCIWMILCSIFQNKLFTADLISGAIVAYLLLGIAWGSMNTLIETVAPGSYSFPLEPDRGSKASLLTYHSFITLTTLGYGDILPVTSITRSSAYLEAVTGVMYTAILVAGLVGNIGKKSERQ